MAFDFNTPKFYPLVGKHQLVQLSWSLFCKSLVNEVVENTMVDLMSILKMMTMTMMTKMMMIWMMLMTMMTMMLMQ